MFSLIRQRVSAAPWLLAPLTAGLASACPGQAGGDPAYGEYLSGTCVTCHGGAATSSGIPPIDALPYDYFVTALKEYRSGIRANPAMVSVARGLGDAEIQALAAFYTQQE